MRAAWAAAGLSLVFLLRAVQAADLSQPATIRFAIHDDDHHPVAGARITMSYQGDPDSAPATAMTDADGVVQFTRSPDTRSSFFPPQWTEHVRVEKDGCVPLDSTEILFSEAQIDAPWLLSKIRRTVITVRGPENQPAAGVHVEIWWEGRSDISGQLYQTSTRSDPAMDTGTDGRLVWNHGPNLGTLRIMVADQALSVPDTGEVSVTLSAAEFQKYGEPHPLTGKLLLPGGAPAQGWLFGQHVTRDPSGGILVSVGIPLNKYLVSRFERVGADGGFSADLPGNYLVLISPEGLPVVYAIDPEMWLPGPHAITLTVPPVTHTITGQFVDEQGKPLAKVAVFPDSMVGGGRHWRVMGGNGYSGGAVNFHLKDGPSPGRIFSDAAGHFSVPVYADMFFSSLRAGTGGLQIEYFPEPQIGSTDRIELRPARSPQRAGALNDITIAFMDGGKQVDGPFIESIATGSSQPATTDPNSPAPLPITSVPFYRDRRGVHVFLSPGDTKLQVVTGDGQWKAASRTLLLSGTGDQRVGYPLDDLPRLKPIRGRLLDAAGNPVIGGSVGAYDETAPANAGTMGRHYYPGTRTDTQGRFQIAGAPDECTLYGSGQDADGHNLFSEIEPMTVTAGKRDVELHAQPGGSVRILLPEELPNPLSGLSRGTNEDFNAADHALTYYGLSAAGADGGIFHVPPYVLRGLENFPGADVKVVPGKTITLDLRDRPIEASLRAAKAWVNLAVSANGKAAAGAEVAVFREMYSAQEIEVRVERWRDAKTPDEEQAAANAIYEAGPRAMDALAALKGDAALQARIDKLKGGVHYSYDGLEPVTIDLADTGGNIRWSALAGSRYVAVARVRGKSAGWLTFQVPGDPTQTPPLLLTLHPIHTLTVADTRSPVRLSITNPVGIERAGLLRLLQGDEIWEGNSLPIYGDTPSGPARIEGIPDGVTVAPSDVSSH